MNTFYKLELSDGKHTIAENGEELDSDVKAILRLGYKPSDIRISVYESD